MRRLTTIIPLTVALTLTAAPPLAATGTAAAQQGCVGEDGEVGITVVVDFGALPEAPTEPSVTCVSVPPDATGSDVLAARAADLGTPAPRYDESGLLCAIDGLPASGCGEPVGDDGFRFWSYWIGDDGGWEFASEGPATRQVDPGAVEGWHFVETSGDEMAPPPDVDPAAAVSGEALDDAADDGATEEDAAAPAAGEDDDDAPWGLIVGVILVVAIAGAAAWVTARRRRA